MKPLDRRHGSGRLPPEQRFAYRIRQALNESAAAIPAAALERLAMARKTALRAQRSGASRHVLAGQAALAGSNGNRDTRFGFGRAGLVFSLLLLVGVCLTGLFQIEQQRRIEELADMDVAVLADELPISAYADHGFNAFLKQNQ